MEEGEEIKRAGIHAVFGQIEMRATAHLVDQHQMAREFDTQSQRQLIFQHQPDHTQRRTPQSKWIFGTGGLFVNRPEATKRIELVRQRDRDRDLVGRHMVGRALRLVMFFNRCGNGRILALQGRITTAHQSLHFGKLADHFRHQIGLGQFRRPSRFGRIRADHRCEFLRQSHDAVDTVCLRAQFFMKHDAQCPQFCQTLIEQTARHLFVTGQGLLIEFPEMPRIRQTRPHHALIARNHLLATIDRLDIGDEDKMIGQGPAFRIPQHETFLIGADRGPHHLRRNFKKARIKGAHQHHGPFDKPCDFFQQSVIFDKFQPACKSLIARFM